MNQSKLSLAVCFLSAAIAMSSLVGCGQGAPPVVAQAAQTEIDNAVKMREMFVKANGNYDSLNAEDKAAYVKLAGSEAAGQAQWATMGKNPVSRPATVGGDPRTGQ